MIDRRGFLALCCQLGFGSTMLPAILWAMAEPKSQITTQMIDAASKIADVPIRYRDRTYGTTNIQRWKHGLLLLKMTAFAARKIKFI